MFQEKALNLHRIVALRLQSAPVRVPDNKEQTTIITLILT